MHSQQPEVSVIRSAKRKKTVQARMVGGVLEVRIPARMSKRQEQEVVADFLARAMQKRTSTVCSDEDLVARARHLNRTVLQGRAEIGSIRWVSNQNTRWASCSVSTADIRVSDRLKSVPDYVVDAVIVHELVHTFVPNHGVEFWEWADKAPLAERAKGYLEAYQRFGLGA